MVIPHQSWVLLEDALAIQEVREGSQALVPARGYCFGQLWHAAHSQQ